MRTQSDGQRVPSYQRSNQLDSLLIFFLSSFLPFQLFGILFTGDIPPETPSTVAVTVATAEL